MSQMKLLTEFGPVLKLCFRPLGEAVDYYKMLLLESPKSFTDVLGVSFYNRSKVIRLSKGTSQIEIMSSVSKSSRIS